jgi:biofilm PGA synthesis N-glycosyltransferase PgaC
VLGGMNVIFFAGIFWIVYVYVGYPLLLVLIATRRRVAPIISEGTSPFVSVLIAAHNEENDIGWKITETLGWDYPPDRLEILVASDASSDTTDKVVRGFEGPRVRFVRMAQRGGKARALNRLAELAQGEILFFTDANAHISPEVLNKMVRHFGDSRVGCVTGDYCSIEERENRTLSKGAGTYWSYESALKDLENALGSVLVCDGAIFCVRSTLFQALHPDLANDLELPTRVGSEGYWVTHEPGALALERDTSSVLQELNRRRRMCAQGMLAMLTLPDVLRGVRGWQFISHKFLRWLSLIPMLMVLSSSATLAGGSTFFASVLAFEGLFYTLAGVGFLMTLGGRPATRLLAVPFYIMLGVIGALVGVGETILGRRFDIWEIPTASRGSAEFQMSPRRDRAKLDRVRSVESRMPNRSN